MADWSHPRIVNPGAARLDWHDIAAEAEASLKRRTGAKPGLISEEEIKVWQVIAADWRWIATGQGAPADASSLALRIDALDQAIERFLKRTDQNGGMMPHEAAQGSYLAAMRHWAHVEANGPVTATVRFLASVGHHFRQQQTAFERIAA